MALLHLQIPNVFLKALDARVQPSGMPASGLSRDGAAPPMNTECFVQDSGCPITTVGHDSFGAERGLNRLSSNGTAFLMFTSGATVAESNRIVQQRRGKDRLL